VSDATAGASSAGQVRVLVYSSNAETRAQVKSAVGTRPDPTLGVVDFVEVATAAVVIEHLDAGGIDVAILDGESSPVGGLGLAKQLKDEIDPCPPVLVLIGRPDDRWLADWSRAEAAVPHPLDPIRLGRAVVDLLRQHSVRVGAPVSRSR
jgi:DNA-binding response OmpR family regulator